MKTSAKVAIVAVAAVTALILGICIGSVTIPPADILRIISSGMRGESLPEDIPAVYTGLLLNIRLPRVLLAFLTGAGMAVSGTVMQSVLKNPLASPYGLGVSAGAGLGAALVMVGGISVSALGTFLLPTTGFVFGLAAMISVIAFTSRIDPGFSNQAIVLTGMVASLFLNAIMSTLAAASPENSQRILQWQLGSFSMKEWSSVQILFPVTLLCTILFTRYARELDIMTFGEEQAATLGVDIKRQKWVLLCVVAVLTGTAVSFAGIIGFVDLIAPHVVRRVFGARHRLVIPMGALFGGAFMVLCDLLARTLLSPSEIPVGSVTAIFGAPFFISIYFMSRKKG